MVQASGSNRGTGAADVSAFILTNYSANVSAKVEIRKVEIVASRVGLTLTAPWKFIRGALVA